MIGIRNALGRPYFPIDGLGTFQAPNAPGGMDRRAGVTLAVCGALLTACVSTTDVLQLGPDTFTVSSTADGMRMAVDARQRALKLDTVISMA
jgi:hypothetical protein